MLTLMSLYAAVSLSENNIRKTSGFVLPSYARAYVYAYFAAVITSVTLVPVMIVTLVPVMIDTGYARVKTSL